MITLSASGGSVTFEFSGNSTYLNDGQITVPVNSLALIIDESDMATFRKAASNDIFVSANIAEFGMTKAELESWYKANMVGSTGGGGGGVTSGEVQTMIDESISGKANSNDVYTTGQTSGATEIANALNAKLDATAYTPVEVSSAITSGDTNAVAGGAVFDAVVYSGNTYNTELTFDANGYAENWVVGQSAITIDVSGYTSTTRADYHFEDSNGLDLGYAHIYKEIGFWGSQWNNSASNCTITTDGDTATTATITDIPSDTVKIRRSSENNPPKAIISGDTPETWIKDALDEHRDNTTVHITTAERTYWNNKSNFSGSYNDLTDKPIPDSALTSYSTNAVQSKTLYNELRIDGEGETETTLTFEGDYTTNYPNGCTKIKVEGITSNSQNIIHFQDDRGNNVGTITVINWGSISVDTSGFQGASYEISGTTVIISYPTVTTVVRLFIVDNAKYTYKAITTSTTPLKDVVLAKADPYSAGTGISIVDNVISATGGGSLNIPISAGTGTYSIQENAGTALGDYSHAEGSNTTAYGDYSHAEGYNTMAISAYSHTEGWQTRANGLAAHAEGYTTKANGENSHAEGNMTETNNLGEHASGSYNLSHKASNTFGDSGNTLFSVGNGTSTGTSRHNAFEIRQNGDIYFEYDGADTKLQDKLDEIETVTAAALNNLNDRVSEDEEVTAAALNNLNDRFGGLSLVKLTQQQYDNLQTKDSNTLYVIVN